MEGELEKSTAPAIPPPLATGPSHYPPSLRAAMACPRNASMAGGPGRGPAAGVAAGPHASGEPCTAPHPPLFDRGRPASGRAGRTWCTSAGPRPRPGSPMRGGRRGRGPACGVAAGPHALGEPGTAPPPPRIDRGRPASGREWSLATKVYNIRLSTCGNMPFGRCFTGFGGLLPEGPQPHGPALLPPTPPWALPRPGAVGG